MNPRPYSISLKGKARPAKILDANGIPVVYRKTFISVGVVADEHAFSVTDPEKVIKTLKAASQPPDIFTFAQRIPDTNVRFKYHCEMDNFAVLRISTYDVWWTKQINDKTRNMIRKAGKKGVEVRVASYDDEFVHGISGIFNETPVRQGKRYWHYGKDLETIRRENATYLDTCVFIGAYIESELIGFVKMIYTDSYAYLMQIISKISHRDKAPTNALLAKAVELCAGKNIPFLVYAKFVYGVKGVDPLSDFKKHHAFERMDFPRYYIPITIKGAIALRLRLHKSFVEILPQPLVFWLLGLRTRWNSRRR